MCVNNKMLPFIAYTILLAMFSSQFVPEIQTYIILPIAIGSAAAIFYVTNYVEFDDLSSTDDDTTTDDDTSTDENLQHNEHVPKCSSNEQNHDNAQNDVSNDGSSSSSDEPNYDQNDETFHVNNSSCKRHSNVTELLSHFCDKEELLLDSEVYDNISLELRRNNINIDDIGINSMKHHIMSPLGYEKYHEHVVHIMSILSGTLSPKITREKYDEIMVMFKQVDAQFNKHRLKINVNFNSSFVLNKLFQLLGLGEILKYFPLHNVDDLHLHDKLWEKICSDLKWKFIASI